MDKIEALYIHIPFCDHICIYCDFYKMIAKEEDQNKYIDYLIKELFLRQNYYKDLKTIYIGGGTPSTLSRYNLNRLLSSINEVININNIIEFTIEANPNDVSREFVKTIQKYHVNRISLGVQSLDDDKLKFLKRNHNKEIVLNALNILNELKFDNISCDLIYGVNNDSSELIINDIDYLVKNNVKHISCYSLIIEDKTILNKMIKEQKYNKMSDDLDYTIYSDINKHLKSIGFNQYEISNYAIPGYESKHNLTYWNDNYYIGIGANSSYYFDHTRFTNFNNLNKYYKTIDDYNGNLNTLETIKLNKDDEMYEFVMLGLRKTKGISKNEFINRFAINIKDKYPNINKLINDNTLIEDNEFIRISDDKLYVMNLVLDKILGDE